MSMADRITASLHREGFDATITPAGNMVHVITDDWTLGVMYTESDRPLFVASGSLDFRAATALMMAIVSHQKATEEAERDAAALTTTERRRLARRRKQITDDDRLTAD